MTEFVVLFLMTKYQVVIQKPFRKQSNVFIFKTKNACHKINALVLKIYNRQQFKHALRWYFRQTHFVLFILQPNKIL